MPSKSRESLKSNWVGAEVSIETLMSQPESAPPLSLFDFALNPTFPATSPTLVSKALVILIAFCECARGAGRAKQAAIFRGWQAVWLS